MSKSNPKVARDPVGEAVAAWLRRALYDEAGRRKMTDTELMRRAKVHRGTLYPILKGEGGLTDDATLARLADVLGVPAPRIEHRFTDEARGVPVTPLAMLREAQSMLERLAARLDADRQRDG